MSTATLLFRYNFANYLLNGTSHQPEAPPGVRRDAIGMAKIVPAEVRKKPEDLVASLGRRLFQAPPGTKQLETFLAYLKTQESPPTDETVRRLVHLMMSTPQFQLA